MKKNVMLLWSVILLTLTAVSMAAAGPNDKEAAMSTLLSPEGAREIYFAGGCFWGTEKLFSGIPGVLDAVSGYANGRADVVPDYPAVCRGDTGYRETVRVTYDPGRVTLSQLLAAYFRVIDPTVYARQGNDTGDQYQTGVYWADDVSGDVVQAYAAREKARHDVFAVEIAPLTRFYPAEAYHQDYLEKNPGGYCHLAPREFAEAAQAVGPVRSAVWSVPDDETLRRTLAPEAYAVTQNAATEAPFTGLYVDNNEKGIYVDVVTGQPLFSSLDKFDSACGWPSFSAPIDAGSVATSSDLSHGLIRTEVRSSTGKSHLGHVFRGPDEGPDGVRYCINSAALRFIPFADMEKEGYGAWLNLFDGQ